MKPFLFILLFFCVCPAWSQEINHQPFDHQQWDQLLARHVKVINDGQATQVDYDGFLRERGQLRDYLDGLSGISPRQFEQWSEQQQLAFLINAYNAWTVELILSEYPDLESIRDLGSLFRSPWKKSFIPLLAETRSLDDIEHELIRGSENFREPRIHFAVNCASIGCPALRWEAYTGDQLDSQLQEATINFLRDRSRNRAEDDTLYVSSIFKWYKEDFQLGWRGANSLAEFFALYSDALQLGEKQTQALRSDQMDIKYLDYDWNLNRISTHE